MNHCHCYHRRILGYRGRPCAGSSPGRDTTWFLPPAGRIVSPSLEQELRAAGATALAVRCDVTKRDEAEELIHRTVREFGRIDVLVNNAGRGHFSSVEDTTDEMIESMFAVNVYALWHTTRPALTYMRAQGIGPHHQCRLDRRQDRLPVQQRLRRGQARLRGVHPCPPAGARGDGHPRQRRLPGGRHDRMGNGHRGRIDPRTVFGIRPGSEEYRRRTRGEAASHRRGHLRRSGRRRDRPLHSRAHGGSVHTERLPRVRRHVRSVPGRGRAVSDPGRARRARRLRATEAQTVTRFRCPRLPESPSRTSPARDLPSRSSPTRTSSDYLTGWELFNRKEYWHAHEAWEAVWKRHPEPSRLFFEGIIQLAAAYHLLTVKRRYRGMMGNFAKAEEKLRLFGETIAGRGVAFRESTCTLLLQHITRSARGNREGRRRSGSRISRRHLPYVACSLTFPRHHRSTAAHRSRSSLHSSCRPPVTVAALTMSRAALAGHRRHRRQPALQDPQCHKLSTQASGGSSS